MKRKAPQKIQTARKSTRSSIRMYNIARQQYLENFEDEEEEISRQEENAMISRPLRSEQLREMMTSDEDEVRSTAGDQSNVQKTVSVATGSGDAIDEGSTTEEENSQLTEVDAQTAQEEQHEQIDLTIEEQVNPQNEKNPQSGQPVQNPNEANSQLESSDDFIVSIESVYSTAPESTNGSRTATTSQAIGASILEDLEDDNTTTPLEDSIEETGWVSEDTVHAFKYKFKTGVTDKNKIAAFDLDGTLITPKSGAKFAKDINDWKLNSGGLKKKIEALLKQGYNFVIFSNQMGVSLRFISLKQIKTKFENIVRHLDLPCVALFATSQDRARKPAIGMLEFYRTINVNKLDLQSSLFVGDAMGRPKDHSAADMLFAFNNKMPFIPIESFISGFEKAKLFEYKHLATFRVPSYPTDPATQKPLRILLKKVEPADQKQDTEFFSCDDLVMEIKSNLKRVEELEGFKLTVILLIGLHGSGKSYFAKNHLEGDHDTDCEVIAHETGNGFEADKKQFESFVAANKRRIVIDYPNLDYAERKRWTSLAKANKAVLIGIHFDLQQDQCAHNVRFRAYYTDHDRKAPTLAQIIKQSNAFREPEYLEGFNWIYKLDFIPSFDVVQKRVYYTHFLLDK